MEERRGGRSRKWKVASGSAVVAEYDFVAAVFLVAAIFAALALLRRDLSRGTAFTLMPCCEIYWAISGSGRSVLVSVSRSL
jgi:hypothetical protein